MLGSVLILGGDKKERLKKAWELLAEHGFKGDNKDTVDPDLLIIQREEGKKSVGITQAREVKDFLRERPLRRKAKAILVEDAQAFTDDAQGSLLKILEEPPVFGLIILLADKEGALLPTVVSRCQRIVVSQGRFDLENRKSTRKGTKGTAEEDGQGDVKSDSEIDDADKSDQKDLNKGRTASISPTKSRFNLSSYSYEELFDLAKDLSAKGKEEALNFLEQVLREDIKNNAPLPVVQKMEKALKDLKEANVALKYALEHLFLLHCK